MRSKLGQTNQSGRLGAPKDVLRRLGLVDEETGEIQEAHAWWEDVDAEEGTVVLNFDPQDD